jgi:hypothetical protein
VQQLTKLETDDLVGENPDINWRNVPAVVLTEIFNRVNIQLQNENIPGVTYDVFSWRMARAIQHTTCKSHNTVPP